MRCFIKSYGISKNNKSYNPDERFIGWSHEGWSNLLHYATFKEKKFGRIKDLPIGTRFVIHIVDVGFMGIQVTEGKSYKDSSIDDEEFCYVIDVSSYHVLPFAECAIPISETRDWSESFSKRTYQSGFVEISKEEFLLVEASLRKEVSQYGTWK